MNEANVVTMALRQMLPSAKIAEALNPLLQPSRVPRTAQAAVLLIKEEFHICNLKTSHHYQKQQANIPLKPI